MSKQISWAELPGPMPLADAAVCLRVFGMRSIGLHTVARYAMAAVDMPIARPNVDFTQQNFSEAATGNSRFNSSASKFVAVAASHGLLQYGHKVYSERGEELDTYIPGPPMESLCRTYNDTYLTALARHPRFAEAEMNAGLILNTAIGGYEWLHRYAGTPMPGALGKRIEDAAQHADGPHHPFYVVRAALETIAASRVITHQIEVKVGEVIAAARPPF